MIPHVCCTPKTFRISTLVSLDLLVHLSVYMLDLPKVGKDTYFKIGRSSLIFRFMILVLVVFQVGYANVREANTIG